MRRLIASSLRDRAVHPLLWIVTVSLSVAVLVAGSHCELVGMASRPANGHSCCASEPSDATPSPEVSFCCNAVEGALPVATTAPAASLVVLGEAWAVLEDRPVVVRAEFPREWVAGHGPPGGSPFVQEVLRSSLPAHGPPAFVA